jgi:hypothetical protein
MTMILAAIFAILCFSVAITGFTSLGNITDPQQLSDAKGFAGFWAFLGSVSIVFGLVSWWMARTEKEGGGTSQADPSDRKAP